jgi:hypothetical protein
MKRTAKTARQQVEQVVRSYLDIDEDGCQVTTLNVPDLDSLVTELAELLTKAKGA